MFETALDSPFDAASVQHLRQVLRKYSKKQALSAVAGLLTVPRFQANTYRLEILVHLVVSSCQGEMPVKPKNVVNWLNRQLGGHPVASMEDPSEDVFVANVVSRAGEFLVLGGLWETPDAATTLMLEILEGAPSNLDQAYLQPVYALLKLSDLILRRAGLHRWTFEPSRPQRPFPEGAGLQWQLSVGRTTVSRDELQAAGISLAQLQPFIFQSKDEAALLTGRYEESLLQQHPLLQFEDDIVFSLPSAVTYAARRYLLRELSASGSIQHFQDALNYRLTVRSAWFVQGGGRHDVELLPLPPAIETCGALGRSCVFRLGQKRFIHLLLLWDSLEQNAREGLLEPRQYTDLDQAQISSHVVEVRGHVATTNPIDSGHTFALFGHLGQAFMLDVGIESPNWTFDLCRLQDLEYILSDGPGGLDKLVLLLNQCDALRREGFEFSNPSGLLNLYAFWIEQSCYPILPEMPRDEPTYLQLGSDHLTGLRIKHRRATDLHCELNVFGHWDTVIHANRNSIYPLLRELPAYISVARMRGGNLCFCIPAGDTSVWISVIGKPENEWSQYAAYRLWEELQLLVFKALASSSHSPRFDQPAVEIVLDLQNIAPVEVARNDSSLNETYALKRHTALPIVKIVAGAAFLRTFSGVANDGERKLLAAVLSGLQKFQSSADAVSPDSEEQARLALEGLDAKVLHAFESNRPVEALLATHANPVFDRPDEHVGAALRSAFGWYPAIRAPRKLSREDSGVALNAAVTHLMNRISEQLRRFDRKELVSQLIFLHETQLNDKQRWHSTARAVQALYGADDGRKAAQRADTLRSEMSITIRTLVEAAVCECGSDGGLSPDDYSVDEMYGAMCALITLGRDSEAIYHGLSSSGITVYPGGAYAFSADVFKAIGAPYANQTFASGYADAAADYEGWVLPSEQAAVRTEADIFSLPYFREAFAAEYRLEFPAFVEVVAALIDSFVDRDDVVHAFTRAELLQLTAERDVTAGDVDAFLLSFALPSRQTWAPQAPVKARDVEPWRFERRLSVMLRPAITCLAGDITYYVIGVGTLRDSVSYMLDSTVNARFDKDVFLSREMRSYLGRKIDEAGRAFTHEVASKLRELGWFAKEEVKLTQLGAGKSPNLGDVDVLAWTAEGSVMAIECKRLKGARTVAEIAQSCSRFAGREGDHLHKHLRRIAWLNANREKVAAFLGVSHANLRIENPLVTNAEVPFSYVKDLPLRRDRIVPFATLSRFISDVFPSLIGAKV
jgi:hypothetical protein